MTRSPQSSELLHERFGFKTASYLSAAASDLPHDVSERLRAARAQAVSKRKIAKAQTVTSVVNTGNAAALTWSSDEGLGWWGRIGSVIPLIALVVGLLAIGSFQSDHRARELAEIDSALLTDELPPAAFADPGFIQYLKSTR